jgi:short subunit fatty acids transporter
MFCDRITGLEVRNIMGYYLVAMVVAGILICGIFIIADNAIY